MNPTDPAMLAAMAALSQHVTGLGTAVTLLAQQQNNQQASKSPGGAAKPGDPAAPEKRPGAKESGDGGPLGKALGFATAKVMAFLAPIVAVSTILGQTISGLSMFTAAIRVLGTTLAPFILPVFAILAAAIVAVSDELWDGIKNVLPAWYGFILHHAIPAFVSLVSAVRTVIDWFKRLSGGPDQLAGRRDGDAMPTVGGDQSGGTDFFHDPSKAPPVRLAVPQPVDGMSPDRVRAEWAAIGDEVKRALRDRDVAAARHGMDSPEYRAAEVARREATNQRNHYLKGFEGDETANRARLDRGDVPQIKGALPPLPPMPGSPGATPGGDNRPSPAARFNTALRDVVTSLRMQMGPPAAILASGGVNRQAQMDSMKEDPLERRMRERSFAALEMFMQAIPKIEQNTQPRQEGFFGN